MFLLFFLISVGCKESAKDGISDEVTFELQDHPVNSEAYTYPDSARLKDAMASFQLEPGLRIELVAAEPLVVDPVAFAFDEDRVMYVVENRGYPDPADGGTPTRLGRIARLEDTNGDGRYDKRTEFATDLTYPNGILPWKGGIFVTCAPDILYLKDTDGDGVADVKKTVLTGFNSDRTAQIRVSHPILGMDGWVYVTSGLNGGNVYSPDHPERPVVSFAASDGRFHPETFEFETTGGRSQFGLTFDTFGRRFGASNRHPMQHIVLDPKYLKRNPHLLFNETIHNVAKSEADAVVYPISNAVTSADFIPKLIGLSHKGTFTSACGLLVYNGTGLGENHIGNAFICEPAQNLVQRQLIEPDGITFKSEVPYEGREFLASTDTWFNPVFLDHGPEGALYVADMYRKVIDHPSYVPEEARGDLDFESGKDAGRIYRIVDKGFDQNKYEYAGLKSGLDAAELVRELESGEEWVRATAFRLLSEKKDGSIVPKLKEIALEASQAESRVRALWLLNALQSLDSDLIRKAMKDKSEGVREQTVLLAEEVWKRDGELLELLVNATRDDSPRVRFVSALMLGSVEGPTVISGLATVAAADGADRWVRAGVLSGAGGRLTEFLQEFRDREEADPLAFSEVMKDLGLLFGNGGSLDEGRALLLDMVKDEGDFNWRISTALGLVEGMSGRLKGQNREEGLLFEVMGDKATEDDLKAMNDFLAEVSDRALDNSRSNRSREVATSLLGYSNFERSQVVLGELLNARTPPEVQLAAVASIARFRDVRGGELLTENKTWSGFTPRVKTAVVSTMVSTPAFIDILFTGIEEGQIGAAEISSTQRQRLLQSKDPQISQRAEVIFKELEGGGRMEVYENYRKVLDLEGDAVSGKTVFESVCATCHTYAGEGGIVGPDLTGVNNQPADALLLHTLVPNYEVLPAYQAVSVETNDGRSISGWLLAETDNSLTLRTAFGTEEPVLRSNIVSINNSGLSLMPDGLEQSMTEQELADLIAYMKKGE